MAATIGETRSDGSRENSQVAPSSHRRAADDHALGVHDAGSAGLHARAAVCFQSHRGPVGGADGRDWRGAGCWLRSGLVGCAEAKFANLDASQREHCRDVFAGGRSDAPDYGDLALSPEKRAIFDAAWRADHDPQHMAGVGCFARFGGGKITWLRPSQGVKLGFLPCYVFGPKAAFAAPPPPSKGW